MVTTHWALAFALSAACVATITDLRSHTIPNWLTLPLPLLALVLHTLRDGVGGMSFGALGAVTCFVPVYFLFLRGALGGGDVKLFAGLGGLLGARDGLELELTAFVLVAVFAMIVTAWRGRLGRLLGASLRASLFLVAPKSFAPPDSAQDGTELPMGLAIFCATLFLVARSLG